jgi:hypothetical protein
MSAIRPRFAGVHIPSLNHAEFPNTIHSQTVSEQIVTLLRQIEVSMAQGILAWNFTIELVADGILHVALEQTVKNITEEFS